MPAASTSIGFIAAGRSSTYTFRAVDPSYNADTNTLSVEITGQRSGRLFTNSTARLLVGGQQIASTSLGTPRSSFFGSLGSLSGEIPDPGGSVTATIEITLDSYDGSGEMDFAVDTAPPLDPSLLDASCPSATPENPSPGDDVTLSSRVSNANDSPVSATVEIAFGSATQQRTVTIPANGSETATATFTPEEATDYPIDRPEIIDVAEA